jgi:hypothetical protein
VILRATELGHQDPLGYADAVSSEDCLHRIVTPVDIVDREAGSPSEQDGNIGMVGESARSAGPPHECDWRVGLALTLRGNHESGPGAEGGPRCVRRAPLGCRRGTFRRSNLALSPHQGGRDPLRGEPEPESGECTDVMGAPLEGGGAWMSGLGIPLLSAAEMSQSGC